MTQKRKIIIVAVCALIIKLALFLYTVYYTPDAKFLPDSARYVALAKTITETQTHALQSEDGTLEIETFRTPGYPLFLAFLHGTCSLPLNGIIFIQLLIPVVLAYVVYRSAVLIDPRLAQISTVIILFDLPVTIFSLLLLTETVFMFAMGLFMYAFICYLRNKKISWLIISSLLLAAATYIRPISYYLGILIGVFMIAHIRRENYKKILAHVLVFLICVYGLLGLWHYRNYRQVNRWVFSDMQQASMHSYALYGSYTHAHDSNKRAVQPIIYYSTTTMRSFLSLMTRPGTLKYFGSHTLKAAGKIVGYPWMCFWCMGFAVGILRLLKNEYLQFLGIVVGYFITLSILGAFAIVSSRFRVPMMPYLAIISALGWGYITARYRAIRR